MCDPSLLILEMHDDWSHHRLTCSTEPCRIVPHRTALRTANGAASPAHTQHSAPKAQQPAQPSPFPHSIAGREAAATDRIQGAPGDPTQRLVIGRRHDLARLFRVIATGARACVPSRGKLTGYWQRPLPLPRRSGNIRTVLYCAVTVQYSTVYTYGNCKLLQLTGRTAGRWAALWGPDRIGCCSWGIGVVFYGFVWRWEVSCGCACSVNLQLRRVGWFQLRC